MNPQNNSFPKYVGEYLFFRYIQNINTLDEIALNSHYENHFKLFDDFETQLDISLKKCIADIYLVRNLKNGSSWQTIGETIHNNMVHTKSSPGEWINRFFPRNAKENSKEASTQTDPCYEKKDVSIQIDLLKPKESKTCEVQTDINAIIAHCSAGQTHAEIDAQSSKSMNSIETFNNALMIQNDQSNEINKIHSVEVKNYNEKWASTNKKLNYTYNNQKANQNCETSSLKSPPIYSQKSSKKSINSNQNKKKFEKSSEKNSQKPKFSSLMQQYKHKQSQMPWEKTYKERYDHRNSINNESLREHPKDETRLRFNQNLYPSNFNNNIHSYPTNTRKWQERKRPREHIYRDSSIQNKHSLLYEKSNGKYFKIPQNFDIRNDSYLVRQLKRILMPIIINWVTATTFDIQPERNMGYSTENFHNIKHKQRIHSKNISFETNYI